MGIDVKNNCRPLSWKSENKQTIWDTSEKDLHSTYRETQGSKTKDDSSTNGSGNEQDLFISVDKNHKKWHYYIQAKNVKDLRIKRC